MVEVDLACFLEVQLFSRDPTKSYDEAVHGNHRLHRDVVPHILYEGPEFRAVVACKEHCDGVLNS